MHDYLQVIGYAILIVKWKFKTLKYPGMLVLGLSLGNEGQDLGIGF